MLALFVMLGLQGWNSDNFSDFSPFGFTGITSAAGLIFFSYIGRARERLAEDLTAVRWSTIRAPRRPGWSRRPSSTARG